MRYRGHSITHRSACALPLTLIQRHSALCRRGQDLSLQRPCCGSVFFLPPQGGRREERARADCTNDLWSPMSPGTTNKKIKKSTVGDFCAPYCSSFFSCSCSCSCSCSKRSSIAIRPIGPQVPANLFDQRSASPQFKQPSSTSTVRRGGLSTASLSTSTTKTIV